jgi:hypothetical protein
MAWEGLPIALVLIPVARTVAVLVPATPTLWSGEVR